MSEITKNVCVCVCSFKEVWYIIKQSRNGDATEDWFCARQVAMICIHTQLKLVFRIGM